MKETMLIFDLDGTLWDSAKGVARSWNEILEKRFPEKSNLSEEDIHNVMGKTMDDIAKILMPDAEPALRKDIFDECMTYENEYLAARGGILFPEVEATLAELSKDYKLAIVSNCQEGYINAFLKSMNMGRYFCDIEEWGRTGLSKGKNIRLVMERNNASRALYIGDTEGDEKACVEAEVPFIHAAYGFGGAKSPAYVIKSFGELKKALKELD